MRYARCTIVAFALMVAAANTAQADDPLAREVVNKAIAAQGGEALAKLQAYTARMKGTFHGLGAAIDFSGELASQAADQQKIVIDAEADGQKLRISHVLNRDKCWVQFNDQTQELEGDDLAEAKEEAHGQWVATLIPLKDPNFSLALVGEANIDNRPALGVTASCKGRRDVNLYFDKETGLLIKTEMRVKDDTTGQEMTEESFFSEYKVVQGTKHAMKFVVKRDGKLYSEGEVSDLQLVEKLDDSVFARP